MPLHRVVPRGLSERFQTVRGVVSDSGAAAAAGVEASRVRLTGAVHSLDWEERARVLDDHRAFIRASRTLARASAEMSPLAVGELMSRERALFVFVSLEHVTVLWETRPALARKLLLLALQA